jgi:hypothetical protein
MRAIVNEFTPDTLFRCRTICQAHHACGGAWQNLINLGLGALLGQYRPNPTIDPT